MKKKITYFATYQKFREEIKHDDGTKEVKDNGFMRKELKEKVITSDNATIVILDDGTKGVAKCDPADDFNHTTGIKVAYIRAKIKSLKKELKQLTGKKY